MEITIEKLLGIIKKNLIFILIVGILFGAIAYIITDFFISPTYEASISIYVDTPINQQTTIDNQRKKAQTYITILSTVQFCEQLLDKVDSNISDNFTASSLQSNIKFSILNNTEVFRMTIEGKNPQDLIAIAEAAVIFAPDYIKTIDKVANVSIIENPINDKIMKPVSPSLSKNTVIGVILGLAFSFGLVFLKEMLDVRIKSAEDITSRFNYPIIGKIPIFYGETKK